MAKTFIFIIALLSFFSCEKDKTKGNLEMVFYLQYGEEPLEMLDTFVFPISGQKISFTRYAAYLSQVELIQNDGIKTRIQDIDFLDMTNAHVGNNLGKGYSFTIKDIEPGFFKGIQFGLGVPSDLNSKAPNEYPSSHVLSSSANYWTSWKSYIFTRTEGKIDQDKNGSLEDTFTLHCGGDNAYFSFTGYKDIQVAGGETTRIEIILDMEKYFNGNTLYDISNFPALHSLEHIPAMNVLKDNLNVALRLK